MKKIIDGKLYNTETATELVKVVKTMRLCMKENGEYFLAEETMTYDGTKLYTKAEGAVTMLKETEAMKWAEENVSAEEYCGIFGEPEE